MSFAFDTDADGFPKLWGADDWADSAHLCGILEFLEIEDNINANKYVLVSEESGPRYVRHPLEIRYDMSRDNAILLMYALYKQNQPDLINLDYIDGKDIYSPAVSGMVRAMKGKDPFPWQTWNFRKELEVNWDYQKLEEPFQIIVMCDAYGGDWLKEWTRNNNLWQYAIKRYLSELDGAWRKSGMLTDLAIAKVEEKIK